jgi:alkanesulfonate monooxygenase SsuD/methylene tetrahydromethanopterin reductase-like flavin-dependent oxidoreductase (luciferase family)
LLPTREAVMSGRFETAPLLRMAEQVEALGYDSVWVGDSLLARPRFEPLTLLAAVAARTTRVQLGTAVLLPALRHPLILAQLVATVDRIAEGRLILGVGIAPDSPAVRREFEAAGVPFDQRVGRLVESIDICRRLWMGEPVTLKGRYHTLTGAQLTPTPHRRGGPPIWMGGEVEAATQRAGRLAEAWVPNSVTPEAWAAGWPRVQAEAQAAGRKREAVAPALYIPIRRPRAGRCGRSWRATTARPTRRSPASRASTPATLPRASNGCARSPRLACATSSCASAAATSPSSWNAPRARSCLGSARREPPAKRPPSQ